MQLSIVMPVRNAQATLPDCIASIISQSLEEFETIVVDDGSEDRSLRLLEEWARGDRRVRLVQPGRVGMVAALNLGVAEARGALIARMDADDIMDRDRLLMQSETFQSKPDHAVIGCQVRLFPESEIRAGYREYLRWQNSCVSAEVIAQNIYVESPFAHPSVMFRRDTFLAAGGYKEGAFPEDYELWLRLNAAGHRMAKVPCVLLHWREQPNRASRVDPRYSRAAFDRLRARYLAVDPRLNSCRQLVIWGAGRKSRKRTRLAVDAGLKPIAWVDIDPDKIGATLWGLPIYPPDWLARRSPRPFVLIYVTNHGARDLIEQSLKAMGYSAGNDYLAVG